MGFLFDSPSWVLSSLLIVIPSCLLSALALWLVRKGISEETLRKNHDVAGFTFSIIGVLYSVILGFIVINVQTRYNKAQEIVYEEATLLTDLYRDAEFFPEDSMKKIRKGLREYVHYIVNDEWQSIQTKKKQLYAQSMMQKLWHRYYEIDLTDEKVRILYEQSIGKLNDLMNAHLQREFNSWEHLGSMMWSLLISGALITISFMGFFGLENVRTQMLMTALLTGYLSFMLYLVFSLDHVFSGPGKISFHVFEQALTIFDRWDL